MKAYKKSLIGTLCALTAVCFAGGVAQILPETKTVDAAATEISLDFTDTMDGAYFKAPTSNYGWKVSKGALTPDNSLVKANQIGYLEQGIALNEQKYISLDFYASACPFDIMLLPYAETVNPWATGVGLHCVDNTVGKYIRLDTYIDANTGHIADYTGIGNGVDGLAHKLEILSDGTNLTFKLDGVDAFTGSTVAIPAETAQLLFRAPEGSYIDNLYIGTSAPTKTSDVVDVDFTDKLDENGFATAALSGWQNVNGKFHPVDEGALYNAAATKYSQAIDLTGTKYISFDFYSTATTFDVGLLDTAAGNIWGNALFIHMPFSDGATIGINSYVDCTSGVYYDGVSINVVDGNAHTLEIFVNNGKISYALDGNALVGNGGTSQFDAPSDSAYLVFRAVGTASYIDNLYIADSAPTDVDLDFATGIDGNAFTAWNSAGWSVNAKGEYVANDKWATVQTVEKLDLTKNQKITFDVFLSSADTNKQFNVGFFSEENLANSANENSGKNYSLGSTLYLGSSFNRNHWIADAAANLYNDTWHSVTVSVLDGNMTIAVDGVAYDALTTAIPADTAYMLIQSTSTENLLDNLKITVLPEEVSPYDGVFEKYGSGTGWDYKNGKYSPNAAWSVVSSVEKLDVTKDWKLSFNAYLSSTDADKQFNVGFFASNVEATNAEAGTGLTFSMGSTVWVSTNFGRNGWAGECVKDYFDDTLHAVEITVVNKQLTLSVDGEALAFSANGAPYTPTLTDDEVYILLQATSTENYIADYALQEIKYAVTFQNYDGSVLQSQEASRGETPVYTGETPVKAADAEYTYEFSGWDKEIAAVTGETVYTAQFTATAIPVEADDLGEISLDFTDETDGDTFAAYSGSAGWSVSDGVYRAKAEWASVHSAGKLDLTKYWEIAFDVYLSSADAKKQFNFGFFETTNADTNIQANSGVNYSLGETLFYGSSFGRTQWVADVVADLYTDSVHSVKITVENGQLFIAVDGVQYDTLTADIPANEVYLLMQGTSTETYIDNFVIADEYVNELSLNFHDESQSENMTALAMGGWQISKGRYYPSQAGELTESSVSGSAFKLTAPVSLSENKYISFDFYSTAATFDVGLLDVSAGNMWGNGLFIHLPYKDGTIGVDTYVDCGGEYKFGSTTNVIDNKAHNVQIVVENGVVSYLLDGNALSATTADIPAEAVYLVFRAVGADSYIDNLIISDSPIEYAAPVTYLEELSLDFSDETQGNNFVEVANGGWTVADGKYSPAQAGAMFNASAVKSALPIDLTIDKSISFDFYSTAATFDVGLLDVAAANIWGNGLFIHLPYSDGNTIGVDTYVDCGGTYIKGVVQNPIGEVHTLKIIVAKGLVSYSLDDAIIVKDVAIPADQVYLVFRAVGTDSYIDNLVVEELSESLLTVKDLQGNVLDTVGVKGYYVLPEIEDESKGQFIGYYYNGTLYRVSNEISVDGDGEMLAIFVDISMIDGASIRMDTPTGMRFTSGMDETSYNFLKERGVIEIGTLIAKAEDVVEDGDYSALYYDNEHTHLNIKGNAGRIEDGSFVYTGVLAEIKADHYAWEFAARGYVKVTYYDGYELAFYTNGVSRSVSVVAGLAYADRQPTAGVVDDTSYDHETEDGDYSPYTETQRNILLGFIVSDATDAIYVSPTGNDGNDGSSTSRAVKTLQKAAELAASSESENALILLTDGEHFVEETVSIGSNVTVKSLNRGNATLSGSTTIDKDSITERTDETLGRVWEIPYSEKIDQLYINNSYGVRARYPDAGQELRLFNSDETMQTVSVFADDVAGYSASVLQESVMVIAIQWAASYLRVESVANTTYQNTLALVDFSFCNEDSTVFSRALQISPRSAYHLENSKAFLNAKGEWFYDEGEKKIYYLPYDDETIENTTVRVPVTETLISIKGTAETKVQNVTFDGVNFMYTANKVVDGKQGGQANRNDAFVYTNVSGMENGRNNSAIEAEFVDTVTFKNNVFACMGAGALDFLQGSSNVSIYGNLFRTIGGNGVLVGTLNTVANVVMSAESNTYNDTVNTVNNYFTEIGWQEYGSCAIVYTYAANSKIDQNTINNVNYTGISLGWGWNYLQAGDYLKNNQITGNKITNVMATMNDGGAIYLVGCQPNTLVSGNYIANMYNGAYKYPTDLRDNDQTEQYWWANAAIYLDTAAGSNESATSVVVKDNYIAADVENQRYEFCNVVNVSDDAAYDEYFFTVDGITGDELTINYDNGETAADVADAGASGSALIPETAILFGSHLVDSDTITVYGANLGASYDGTLTINGETVAQSDITAWSDSEITIKTANYAGKAATVRVGDSNRLYTAMNVDVAAELARFDGYIDVENISTWYTALDTQKQAIGSVSVTSGTTVSTEVSNQYNVSDGYLYTVWESEETDTAASISFTLKTAGTVDMLIVYDRTSASAEDGEEAEYRTNIRIVGLTSSGEIELYKSGDAQAYENFGKLILDMETLGYAGTTFTGFRIEKTDGGALAVAEIAVI